MMLEKRDFNVTIRIRFNDGDVAVYGNGISRLLQFTQQNHSIHSAAKEMGMSYPKALKIIERAEAHFNEKLLVKKVGGAEGGGSTLTDFGKMLVYQFKVLEEDVLNYTIQKTEEYFPELLNSSLEIVD